MKLCYFIVLFVLLTPTMAYKQKKIINNKMRTKQKCDKIKCPPIDDPVCVKIKNKQMNEIYIIAINKCEVKYASCNKDVNATIVLMENCLHGDKKHQNIRSKRNKRDVDESSSDDSSNGSDDQREWTDIENEENQALNDQADDDDSEGNDLLSGQSDDDEDEENELLKGQSDDDEDEENELLKGQSDDDEDEENELLKGLSDDNGEVNETAKTLNEEEKNKSELDGKNYEDLMNRSVEVKTKSGVDENYVEKLKAVDNVGSDYDQHDEEVDLKENNKNCPTVCPSRDVMVCAKCQHNIHRTFLSPCHLRMFACKHTREKLQLVKREPCVQSAPFVSEFNKTKGRIPESGEHDEVHKFIFCREKNLLNKDDPRCRFVEKDE